MKSIPIMSKENSCKMHKYKLSYDRYSKEGMKLQR